MDFSKKYVTMCKEAEEIQNKWEVTTGDFFWDEDYARILVVTGYRDAAFHATKPHKIRISKAFKVGSVWLPRQDQLQELMPTKSNCLNLVKMFHEFVWGKGTHDYCRKFNSCEQFWLSFVMWLKYNKIWVDERKEWVKIEEVEK